MDLADFNIVHADRSHDATLVPLLQQYCHDMEEWIPLESDQAEGFTYSLGKVWGDGAQVYLAYIAETPIGFALVGSAARYVGDPGMKDIVEFFVTRHVRRHGIGRTMAAHVWNQFPGPWLVRVYHGNVPAMRFWASAIADYTCGHYREEVRSISGKTWSYFTFASFANSRLERTRSV